MVRDEGYSTWKPSSICNAIQNLPTQGTNTLALPDSDKSIQINWIGPVKKGNNNSYSYYNFEDPEPPETKDKSSAQGIFYFGLTKLKMNYIYDHRIRGYRGQSFEHVAQKAENAESLPCGWLILGIISPGLEFSLFEKEPELDVWNLYIYQKVSDIPGDMYKSTTERRRHYRFDLVEMSCTFTFNFYFDAGE